jgi:hypothetical protein
LNYISLYTNKYGETRRNRQAEKKQTHIAQAQAEAEAEAEPEAYKQRHNG